MMKLNRIWVITAASLMTLVGCSNSEPDYSEFYKDPESAKVDDDDPTLGENQIKVMSFNIRYYNTTDADGKDWDSRKAAFLPMINEKKPTVIGMQEARPPQLTWLKDNWTDYDYIGKGRRGNNSNNDEFTPIFYKKSAVELVNWGYFWLSETPDVVGSVSWGADVPRIAVWAIFKDKSANKKFFFLNTHLDVVSKEAPGKSMELIVAKMAELNTENLPSLLTADFNKQIDSEIFNGVKTFMTVVRSEAPVTDTKYSYTGFGTNTPYIVDHIFSTGFKPLKFETIDKTYENVAYISDHYPVMGTLEYK